MKAKTRKQAVFLNSLATAGALLILSACGDGRPDPSPNTTETRQDNIRPETNNPDFSNNTPLASDVLLGQLRRFSNPTGGAVLSDLRMSTAQGDLSENMLFKSEALGLWSGSGGLGLVASNQNLPDGLSWTSGSANQELQLTDVDGERMHEFQLNFEGIPVHGARLKTIHDHTSNTPTYMTGSVPRWANQTAGVSPRVVPFALSINEARSMAARELMFGAGRLQSSGRVYIPEENQTLHAAYLFNVSADSKDEGRGPHVPLEVAVSADTGKVIWQRPLALHINGEASLYVENKKTAQVVTPVALPNLVADGTRLQHPLFEVYNCKQQTIGNNCVAQIYAVTNGNYKDVLYDSESYDELVSYAAISKAMAWFNAVDQNSLRSSWDESKWPGARVNFGLIPLGTNGGNETRLTVFVRTRTPTSTGDTTPDNAQYLWSGSSGRGGPQILIGYGGYTTTKQGLRDLGKDMDVVMHEFGHHIVFRGLSNSKEQAVAMHEGLADYFTYAISGNNLLAEYSRPLQVALRQGNIAPGTTFKNFKSNNKGGYTSVMDNIKSPHLVGEFWSGILWEIRGQMGRDGSGNYKFDKIVWDSIDLLKSDAGLYDGIIGFVESTKRYAQRTGDDATALQKLVKDTFVKYGFVVYTSAGEIAAVAELAGAVSSSNQPVTKVNKTSRWGCGDLSSMGSIGRQVNGITNAGQSWLMFILLLCPVLFSVVLPASRKAAQRVAIRVRTQRRRN